MIPLNLEHTPVIFPTYSYEILSPHMVINYFYIDTDFIKFVYEI